MKTLRQIRSFVRRESRLTNAQKRALDNLAARYFIPENNQKLDFDALFGRHGNTVLEIGFGDGKSLAVMAQAQPETNFLGIEVHRPGIGSLLQALEVAGLKNVRVSNRDAVVVIKNQVADNSLDAVHLFFPDPWPKKRHHKRRIINQAFLSEIARVLKPAGLLHLATDWQDYAAHMMQELGRHKSFRNKAGVNKYSDKPAYRPETKFERRGLKLGHKVRDIVFTRV
ncbi:MAG: tRNA (guanosine(46)-N7)-methyltransferase TrmB [Acidiferrobacterales bacterium]